jgi:Cytochrome c7 and related cytochrome c
VAQLFSSRFGFFFRIVLLGGALAIFGAVFLWHELTAYAGAARDPLAQPVPFSHKHHVGDEGIDCRYCHASVETSAFAGMPSISTCMNCHSQLFTDQPALAPLLRAYESHIPLHWRRVHQLPDFVYFNHSIHVAKGIGCASCHGPVDEMPLTWRTAPLTMRWCLGCHREPAKYLRPPEQVFDLHWQAKDQLAVGTRLLRSYQIDTQRLTDCSICHR